MSVSSFRYDFAGFVMGAALVAAPTCAVVTSWAYLADYVPVSIRMERSPDPARTSFVKPAVLAVKVAGNVERSQQGVRSVPPSQTNYLREAAAGLLYETTAYSHTCTLPRFGPERPPQRAANGRWPVADLTVAADTSLHPFGTELLVEGLGFRRVDDTGHAIRGRRLDLFVDSCREARAFGRRWLRVHVVPAETTREARR